MLSAGLSTSICDSTAGNIVANCGFETGDFTSWTLVDPNTFSFTAVEGVGDVDINPNSGSFFAGLGSSPLDASLSQTLTTISGTPYTFSFWLASDGATSNDFTAQWNGTNVLALTDIPSTTTPYTLYSFTETASSTSTVINFLASSAGYLALDDVSVVVDPPATGTPEPGNLVSACMLLGLMGGYAGLRNYRKARS